MEGNTDSEILADGVKNRRDGYWTKFSESKLIQVERKILNGKYLKFFNQYVYLD